MDSKEDEVVAFGKTRREIAEMAAALSKYKDKNEPVTSSYKEYIDFVHAGHEAILAQKDNEKQFKQGSNFAESKS